MPGALLFSLAKSLVVTKADAKTVAIVGVNAAEGDATTRNPAVVLSAKLQAPRSWHDAPGVCSTSFVALRVEEPEAAEQRL